MGLPELASAASYWRGFYYFEEGAVKSIVKVGVDRYEGIVVGQKQYRVSIDVNHRKKDSCTCPHARGSTRVCKHQMALFFAICPSEYAFAKQLIKAQETRQEKKTKSYNQLYETFRKEAEAYVNALPISKVKELFIEHLVDERMPDFEDCDDFETMNAEDYDEDSPTNRDEFGNVIKRTFIDDIADISEIEHTLFSPENRYEVGDKIVHRLFGEGIILRVDQRNIGFVHFKQQGIYQMLLDHPLIKKID